MSTRIEVKYVCDRCHDDTFAQEQVKSFRVTSKALGRQEYEFDLCDKCSVDFQSEFLPFHKGLKKAIGSVPCPVPGCTFVGPNNMSLGQHKRGMHPELVKQPTPKKTAKGVPCTEDGCDYVAVNTQGLRMHLRRSKSHQKVSA